jgi:hypothetical protein
MSQGPSQSLLRSLSAHQPGRGKLYPPDTQARVVEFAQRRRAEGVSWNQIAGELGMRFETVRRWCARAPTMRAVEVVAETRPSGAVSVLSPSGYRLEGLTLEEAVTVLRALE